MKVERSVIIDRLPEDVFAFLEVRANDTAWMASVRESEWLDPTAPMGVGRRGRMVMTSFRRRAEYIDEVTAFEPGRRIAHRTVEGPIPLNTACICEQAGGGCRATVVGEAERLPGGVFGRLAAPVIATLIGHGFKADLAKLKSVLEADGAGRLSDETDLDPPRAAGAREEKGFHGSD